MTGIGNEEEAQFARILQAILSTENEERQAAEASYEQIAPEKKVFFLLTFMRNEGAPEELRQLCAVMLRRLLTTQFDYVWSRFAPEAQAQVKQEMLTLLAKENENLTMRKKLSEVAAELVRNLINDDGTNTWPEFIQFLFQLSNSPNPVQKQTALIVFSLVPSLFGNQQNAYLEPLKQMLSQSFQSNEYFVRFQAGKALACFITDHDKEESVLRHFSELVPLYLKAMEESVRLQEDDALLKLAIEVIGLVPKFFRPHLGNFLEMCYGIAKESQVEDDWRHLALEFTITAAENVPGAVKKVGGHLIPQYISLLLDMMTEQDDDREEWATSDETLEEDSDSNPAMAESSLDRLACALGGKTVLPIVIQQVQVLLGSAEWEKRYAGLMAVSAVGEGCSKQMETVLDRVIDPILNFLKDADPRVQYAACNAIGQMATDFAPGYEKKYHSKILPGLISLLEDNFCARVQAHAGAALVNFCEECPKDILKNYAEPLLAKLEACFNKKLMELQTQNKKLVLEQLVTTVAAIANTLEEDFAPFYEKFMPCMKYIMENANAVELRLLRGKTIECASLIGLAVGAERFTADASAIMELLLRTQVDNGGVNFEDDDPQLSYMITAWARICQILGPSFAPYLPMVMTPVLRTASIKPELQVLDPEDVQDVENAEDWELISLGESQNVGLHTAKLEDKAMACQMLVCYARVMKEHFRPYVEEVVKLVSPLLKFYFHDGVRSSAAEIIPHLLKSVSGNVNEMIALWNMLNKDLLIATEAEPESEVKVEQLHAIALCVELLPPEALDAETMQKITSVVEKVFTDHFERSAERAEQRNDEDFDEVVEQQLWDEMEDDNYILTKAADIIHAALKVHKSNYLPYMEPKVLELVTKLVAPDRYWQEKQWGICIWDDIMEFTGPAAAKYQNIFMPTLLSFLSDQSPEVRQAASYGCGIMAQYGHETFAQICTQAVPLLVRIVADPEARSENNISATENAVSAVAKIIKHCPSSINPSEIIPLWFSWLPIWEDKDEMESVYGLLCDLCESNSPFAIGQDGSNLPQIIRIIAESLYRKCLPESSVVYGRMINLVRMVNGNPTMVQMCFLPLPPELQQALQTALHHIPTSS